MNEFEQKIFALKTLNELYQLATDTGATINSLQLIHKSSYSYMVDENFYNTIPSVNHLGFIITHESVVYYCEGKNGANGKIVIYSTSRKDKYNG